MAKGKSQPGGAKVMGATKSAGGKPKPQGTATKMGGAKGQKGK